MYLVINESQIKIRRKNSCYGIVYLEEKKMPIVHVNVWDGFGEEKIKTVIRKGVPTL